MAGSNRSGRAVVLVLLVLTIVLIAGGGYYWFSYNKGPEGLRQQARDAIGAGDNRRGVAIMQQMLPHLPNDVRLRYALYDNMRLVAKESDPTALPPPEAIDHLLVASQLEPRNSLYLDKLYENFSRMSRAQMAQLKHEEFNRMTPGAAAGRIASRLLAMGRADSDMTAFAIQYAVDMKDVKYLEAVSNRLTGDTTGNEIIKAAVSVKINEVHGRTERVYWEAEPLVSRLLQTSAVRLQSLDARHLPFLGMLLEGSVRYAPTGAVADSRLLRSMSLVHRLSVGDLGKRYRVELVELIARPVSAAMRSRVREGLDVGATTAERSNPRDRRKALEMFVEFAEPVFGMGVVSPFAYEQMSRAALELENDEKAISFLKQGIRQYLRLAPDNQNELMAVHAQAAMRLIARGELEAVRDDIDQLKVHEHTRELSQLLEGLLAFQQGRFEDARQSLDSIPKESQHRIAASGLLVRVLLVQDRWEDALALLEEIDDQWVRVPEVTRHWLAQATGSRDRLKLLKACCLLKLGRVQPAIELLAYLDSTAVSPKSRLIRAIELMRSGNSTRVWEVLREARSTNPDDFDLLLAEFGMLLKEDAHDGARRLLEGFVREHPDQPLAGIAYVSWLRDQGKSAEALAALAVVRSQAPDSVLVWLLSAELMMIERRERELGLLVAEMQQYPVAIRHIPVVHAYAVLRHEKLDEAAAAMLAGSLESWNSQGYTTVKAMTSLPKDNADLAYQQFARSFSLSKVASDDRDHLLDRIGEAFANIDPAAISVHVDEVLEEFPAEPVLLMASIELALRKGAYEKAASRIDTLERVDAVPGRASFMRARMLFASGLSGKALDELGKTLEEAPSFAAARLMSARLEYARREYSRALVDLRKLTWPTSDSEEATLLLARTLANLERSEEAIEMLTARVQKTPNRVEPWLALSQVYASFEKEDMARAVVEQAMQYHPYDVRLQDSLLDLHVKAGSTDTAASLAQSFGGQSPDIDNSIRFARMFLNSGNPEIAANWIGRAHMAPNAQANHELIFLDCLLIHERGVRTGQFHLLQAARRRYEDLLAREPRHIAAMNGLARLLMRDMKETAEGVAVVERIRTIRPLQTLEPEVQSTVAEAYRRNGNPNEALTIIKRCINQHPDSAVLRIEHAAVLLDGFPDDPVKKKLAREELKRAAELRVPANRQTDYAAVSARLT